MLVVGLLQTLANPLLLLEQLKLVEQMLRTHLVLVQMVQHTHNSLNLVRMVFLVAVVVGMDMMAVLVVVAMVVTTMVK